MADLMFPCPKCKTDLAIDEAETGSVIQCPHCNTPNIAVPRPSLRFSCPSCNCKVCAPQFMADKMVACPSCNHGFSVNSKVIDKQPTGSKNCVGCGRSIPADAVFCVTCGVNQNTGMKVQTKLTLREPAHQTSQPELNPILERYQRPPEPTYTWLDKLIPILKAVIILVIIVGAGILIYSKWNDISNIGKTSYDKWSQRNTPPPPPPPPVSPFAKKWAPASTNSSSSTTNQVEATNAMGSISWGIPKEQLKTILAEQNKSLLSETPTAVVYNKTVLCERDCITAYRFKNNELIGEDVAFALPNRRDLIYYTDDNNYLPEYQKLRNLLQIKYGTYIEEKKDIDVGLAMPAWEKKVKKQQENVAFERKNADELCGSPRFLDR